MRIAVAGLGFMGSTHIRALQSIPSAELVAVCSRDEKKLAGDLSAVQGNLGGPGERLDFSAVTKYRDIRQMLEDPRVEAVDLCLPTHLHAPVAIQAFEAGKHVLVANYTGGSVAVLPVKADGMLGEASDFVQHLGSSVDPNRQHEPHAHDVVLTPDNRFAVVADLGLDKLLVYRFDLEKGKLLPNDPPYGRVKPGSGPRHFALHPNGRWAYVISEMGNTITAFDWDGDKGSFHELQTISTLPKDFKGENSTAELAVHPTGRYLYGSNRGHDSIAVYAIDPAKGMLTSIEDVSTLGKEPRNFALDPTGAYLFAANQNSNTVVVFRVNSRNGRLTPSGEKVEVISPVCVTFVAAQ